MPVPAAGSAITGRRKCRSCWPGRSSVTVGKSGFQFSMQAHCQLTSRRTFLQMHTPLSREGVAVSAGNPQTLHGWSDQQPGLAIRIDDGDPGQESNCGLA